MSAPAVFFGGDFETRVVGKTSMVLVPFSCAEGSMTVQIAVAPTTIRHRAAKPA
jgi:CheY-specific phosphatase CheX